MNYRPALFLFLSCLLFAGCGSPAAAPNAKPEPAAASPKAASLEGTWEFVSVEVEGRTIPAEKFKDVQVVFTKDTMTTTGNNRTEKATYTFDSKQTPAAIDLQPETGSVIHGIYELAGDSLKYCLAIKADNPRPTQFSAKQGENATFYVLRRRPVAPAAAEK